MAREQAEINFPEYALAYLRYLAGERGTVPVPTGGPCAERPQYRGIDRDSMKLVHARVRHLVSRADISLANVPTRSAGQTRDGAPGTSEVSDVEVVAMRRLRSAERERRAAIQQLIDLGAVRSHVLVGDIGERIVAAFYRVELAPAFMPGYDLVDRRGRRVQVKTLRATPERPRTIIGEIKQPCDIVFALRLDFDYLPVEGLEIPAGVAQAFVGANGKVSWTRKLAEHPDVRHCAADELRS